LKPSLIKDGFKNSGHYPLNFTVMFNKCYNEIDEEMRSHMLERMQQDVEIFRREGRLTEQEYNDAVIPALDNPEGMP
jgi:hypothetical protein